MMKVQAGWVGDFCVPSMVLAFDAINGKAALPGLKRIAFSECRFFPTD